MGDRPVAAAPGSLVPAPNRTGRTGPPALPNPPPAHLLCTHIDVDYDLTVAIVCSLYICFGMLYSFFGYRCFKIVMFLTGFIFGSVIVYLICLQEALLPAYGNVAVALLAGLLFGLITTLVQYVGLFMTGLHTGLLLGVAGLVVADHFLYHPPASNVWLCVAVLLIAAVTLACLNLYWRKGLTVLGTALYGGALFAGALDYFVERLAALPWLWERVSLRPPQAPPCWFTWLVLAAWPIITAAGLVAQFALTGTGRHHSDTLAGRKKPPRNATASTEHRRPPRNTQERAELRQKKYRYLYQVRTAHGDVISQNYVQALQRKDTLMGGCEMGAGECSTLQSDATHLTILPDTHLATLSESDDDLHIDIHSHHLR